MTESIEAEKIVLRVDVNDDISIGEIEEFVSKLTEFTTRLGDVSAIHIRIAHWFLRESNHSFRVLRSSQFGILNVCWFSFCFLSGVTLLSSNSPFFAVYRLASIYWWTSLRLSQKAIVSIHDKIKTEFLSDAPSEGVTFIKRLHMIGYILPQRTRIRVWTPAVEELVEDWALARSQFPKSIDQLKLKAIFYIRACMLMLNCVGVSTASAISCVLLWIVNRALSAFLSNSTN